VTLLLLTDERPFRLFLKEQGWTSMGYTDRYYPEWLRWTTFPHYERVVARWGHIWRMKSESKKLLGIK